MKILLLPFTVLYRVYFAVVFFLVLALFYPIFWVLLRDPKNYPRVFKLKVFTARVILSLDFIGIKYLSTPPQLKDQPYIICANHSSYLDIILMYRILPRKRFLFIGKSELLGWPVINIFFKKLDIAVDRSKPSSGMQSIIRAKEELNNGWSIAIFPEGGIPDKTPTLHPFKNGAFKLAIETGVPILPITILDNWKLFGSDPILYAPARPGFSKIIIHEPIEVNGMDKKDLIPLRKKTFEIINTPLRQHLHQER